MPHRKIALIRGYKSFRAGDYTEQKKLYEKLGKHGQHPKIMLIACADSRVDPTDIFDAYPGEMFVVRNVANIVPPVDPKGGYHGTSASIEYAVKEIGVESIVVMGHESCGGIQGCLQGLGDDPEAGYVNKWLSLITNVRDKVKARKVPDKDLQFEMELENVRQSIRNLETFDFVRKAIEEDRLKLQGAYFSIIRARLLLSDEDGNFTEVESL
jgi:carbonic anhydrase